VLLADSNIWLALALSKHAFHSDARDWFANVKSSEVVCFCRSTQQSFLRLLTTHEVLSPYGIAALTNEAAWSTYEAFLADKRIAWLDEPSGLDPLWKNLAERTTASPKLWVDAYLAAFAIAGGYQFVTMDKGFKQFSQLDLLILTANN